MFGEKVAVPLRKYFCTIHYILDARIGNKKSLESSLLNQNVKVFVFENTKSLKY